MQITYYHMQMSCLVQISHSRANELITCYDIINWFAWSFLVKELLSCVDNGVLATLATIYNSCTWT